MGAGTSRLHPMRRIAVLTLAGTLTLLSTACSPAARGGEGPRNPSAEGPINPAKISDAQFAESTYRVLLSGEEDSQRLDLLAGVVRHQLARAQKRFRTNRGAGLAALTGGLYLLRSGELRQQMLEGAAPALSAGASEVARVGDEGRSLALYTMLRSVLKEGAEKKDVDSHLAALSRWTATAGNGPMQSAGTLQRTAANRSLLETNPETLKQAREATVAWIHRGLEFNASETPIRSNFEREEAIEAYRSVRAGGATLVALYLRHGDAKGALDALENGDLTRIVPPGLTERLERAASDDDPEAWGDLYRLFESSEDMNRPETSIDGALSRAAAWGTAVELFRAEPKSMRGAAPLSAQLVEYGMAEAAPLVLAPALGEKPSIDELSWGMALVLRAIITEDEIGDLPAARRTFANAKPILTVAGEKEYAGRLRPSAGRLYYVMAALETRAGELGRALPHVEAAVKTEPSQAAYSMLAAIQRQRGDTQRALSTLDQLVALAKRAGDRAAESEASLTQYEIYRDKGDAAQAQASLTRALKGALDARQQARGSAEQARAERILAHVLEHFGAAQGARRATDRAYEASRSDARQLTATLLDAARRALVLGDLNAARKAVHEGVEAGLENEDLVYIALWLRLVEIQQGVPSDGTVEEALANIDEDSGWPAKLAAWARGKLGDSELTAAARSRVQKTEAEFYVAMSHRKKNGQVLPKLEEVAGSQAIELVEVAIARDLVARHKGGVDVSLPAGVQVP